jgi:YD repeat-containing protein
MKKLLIALLLSWAGLALGQQTPTDTTAITKADVSTAVPQSTPKSPTAEGLGRYGSYPVGLYTGVPVIEIPIHAFSVGGLTIPIKLSYHAAGHKVSDFASWVGLGWSLQTGGMISRNVLGLPDEQSGSTGSGGVTILQRPVVVPTYSSACLTGTNEDLMGSLSSNNYDAQRDVFGYQLPGGGRNSFLLFPDPPGYVLRAPGPTKITSTTNLSSFTIVDESGISYRFANSETVQGSAFGDYQSVWYVNEITGLNPVDRAVYSYTTAGVSSPNDVTDQIIVTDQVYNREPTGGISAGVRQSFLNNTITMFQTVPKQIDFPGGKVQFVMENRPNTDEVLGNSRLKTIEVYNTSTGGSYILIKKYELRYTYKARTNGDNVLFLDQVVLTGADNTSLGSYSIAYNPTPLPPQASRAKDYWGFYNGAIGNGTLLPTTSLPYKPALNSGTSSTISIGGAYRESNLTATKAWIIEKLVYPTGGLSEFDFELNQFFKDSVQTAGGLRIRQIRHYATAGALASQKTYRYGTNGTGAGRMRFGKPFASVAKPEFIPTDRLVEKWDGNATDAFYKYRIRVYTSSPSYPLTPDEGSPVTYSAVTEYDDNANGAIGRTVHEFKDDDIGDDAIVINGKGYVKSRSWNRGQLLTKTMYDAQNRLKTREVHSYTTLTTGQTSQLAGVLVSFTRETSVQVGAQYASGNVCNLYSFPVGYQWEFGLVKRSGTTTYLYDDTNPSRYTLRTTQTDYSLRHYQPTETRTYVEGGAIVGTRYSYPQDFTATIPATAEAELQGIKTMQNRNMHLPVETINFRRITPATARSYTTGKLTTFTSQTLNGIPTPLPRQVFLPETDFNSKTYVPVAVSYISSAERFNEAPGIAAYPVHQLWKDRLTMNSYDTQGNLTSFSLTAGPTTTYTYATTTPVGGVPFSYVTGETKNATQSTAQTTTFAYVVPLLGLFSLTDPHGVTTKYEYDNFGRLLRIIDKDGNILKQLSYRYATQLP